MAKSWLWTLTGIIGISVISYGIFFATRTPELPAGLLYGNGHIEGTEVRIASEVGGRVIDMALDEGKRVVRGQKLITIDPQTGRDQLQAAQGELDALQESRKALESQLTLWAHHVETSRRQVARIKNLAAKDLASQLDIDEAENGLQEAQGQINTISAQIEALDGRIESAEARVRLAESSLTKTEVTAPADGTVLVRAVEIGEVIQSGQPLALLVNLDRLELKVYIPERDIGSLRLGNTVRVRVDAFPNRYFEARVSRIDDYAQFTPRDIHMPEERTRMVYGVTLALENGEQLLKPGMPADAWVLLDDTIPWPDELPVPVR